MPALKSVQTRDAEFCYQGLTLTLQLRPSLSCADDACSTSHRRTLSNKGNHPRSQVQFPLKLNIFVENHFAKITNIKLNISIMFLLFIKYLFDAVHKILLTTREKFT